MKSNNKLNPIEIEKLIVRAFNAEKTAGTGRYGEGDAILNNKSVSVKSTVRFVCTVQEKSEMRMANATGRKWYLALAYQDEEGFIMIYLYPVSYTHLTLPTKRIV